MKGKGASFAKANGVLAEDLWTCKGRACNTPTPKAVKPFDCYVVTAHEDEWAIGE